MEFLRKLLPYFLILRPKNLVIVCMTQAFLQYFIILPLFGEKTVLYGYLAPLFIFVTILIAAGGYLINDLFDMHTDRINKPQMSYIPQQISLKSAWTWYWSLLVIGFVLSIIIAIKTKAMHLLWIYPLASGLLFAYSKSLKSTPLWGNMLVSLFTAFVWVILFIAQMAVSTTESGFNYGWLTAVCLFYGLFAFLTNLIREIVKDLEDLEGDTARGLNTTAAAWGIPFTKNIVTGLTLSTVLCLTVWALFSGLFQTFESRMYIFIFIAAPLLGIIIRIKSAFKRQDYTSVSNLLKLIMVAGLFSIFLITKEINSFN